MLNLGENLSWDFGVIYIFCKNEVFNRGRYIKRFSTCKKINDIFLKFSHSLFKMPKIVEIDEIFPAEKRDSKT